MSRLECVGVLTVALAPLSPFLLQSGQQMASFTGDGRIYFGSTALEFVETGLQGDALVEGVDFWPVSDFNAVRFQDGVDDAVFDALLSLQQGDKVKVVLSFDLLMTVKKRKMVASRITQMELIAASPAAATGRLYKPRSSGK